MMPVQTVPAVVVCSQVNFTTTIPVWLQVFWGVKESALSQLLEGGIGRVVQLRAARVGSSLSTRSVATRDSGTTVAPPLCLSR
jgi:hypothetical protein